MPIVAVIATTVLFILVALGFDTARIKRAAAELSRQNEIICSTAASKAVIQRDAVKIFRNQINSLVTLPSLDSAKIIDARLISPTMPTDGSFCEYKDTGCAKTVGLPQVTSGSFATLLDDAAEPVPNGPCNLNCGSAPGCQSDCTFIGDIRNNPNYPKELWSPLWNAGNTIACEIDAVVTGTILRNKKITAKTTWWIPVRGNFDYSSTDVPGLTIAIAPQMTTDAADPKFQFCNSGDPYCGTWGLPYPGGSDSTFRDQYDPLYNYDPATTLLFDGQPGEHPFDSTYQWIPPEEISATCAHQDFSGGPPTGCPANQDRCTGTPPYDQPGINCAAASDREQMLAACMNPVILLRNILLSSIVEHASRHGQLRRGTEILMVGAERRELIDSADLSTLPISFNPPTSIITFGADLALDKFQIPFVSYHAGSLSGPIPPEFQPALRRWLNPFTPDPLVGPPVSDQMKRHEALIADQLRMCYHLYDKAATGTERIPPTNIYNNKFEPIATDGSAAYKVFDPSLRKAAYSSGDDWDQECPWAGACAVAKTRSLGAAELVSVLGSMQKCPYEHQVSDPTNPFLCSKPPSAFSTPHTTIPATLDLRPDLIGLLYYLANEKAPGNSSKMAALNSPGIFPLEYSATPPTLADPEHPMGAGNYSEAINTKTPILLITHQRLNISERDEICQMVSPATVNCNPSGNPGRDLFAGRPITVVYMPTDEGGTSTHRQAVADFRLAFNVPESAPFDSKVHNALFVFSPYIQEHNLDYPGRKPQSEYPGDPPIYVPDSTGPGPFPAQWAYYRQYWKDLLSPDANHQGQDIDTAARTIFYKRILTEDVKF